MTHLEKMELVAHLTTFISGVLKIAILIVALYALEEGRQERRDAATAREETLKVLSLVSATVGVNRGDEVGDRSEDNSGVENFQEVKR